MIFGRFFDRRTDHTDLPGDGRFRQEIVGESHSQPALARLARDRTHLATLRPEPENRHDRYAVRVEIDGRLVGYLPRQDAFLYCNRVAVGDLPDGPARCSAKLFGRNPQEDVGVWLDVRIQPSGESYPCPSCRTPIAPIPTRSRKCPHCQTPLKIRRSQLLTDDQAAEFDRIARR